MSVTPAVGARIDLYQGRTLDITWTLYDDADEEEPTVLTSWKAWLLLWGADIATPVKVLSYAVGVAPTPTVQGTSGVILTALTGGIRAYMTDEDALLLVHTQFEEDPQDDGTMNYKGGYELVLEDPAAERWPYERGPLRFIRSAPIS